MLWVCQLGVCLDSVRVEGAVRVCQPHGVSRGLEGLMGGPCCLAGGELSEPESPSCRAFPAGSTHGGEQLVALTLDVPVLSLAAVWQ